MGKQLKGELPEISVWSLLPKNKPGAVMPNETQRPNGS
jgi:hypothetical protein